MNRLKVAITGVLFLASCASLGIAHEMVSALLQSYTVSYPSSMGPHSPAFTDLTLSLMSQSALICFGTLTLSALLVVAALRRSTSTEAKLYWVTVLAGANYYVSGFLLVAVLAGFFLLPRLANGV